MSKNAVDPGDHIPSANGEPTIDQNGSRIAAACTRLPSDDFSSSIETVAVEWNRVPGVFVVDDVVGSDDIWRGWPTGGGVSRCHDPQEHRDA